MEAVLFIGLQGAGKTTFYQQRFAQTHMRISLDQAKTRARELAQVQWCITQEKPFVVDNTNVTCAQRKRYIDLARPAGYRIVGYYFEPDIPGSLRRNAARTGKERIPVAGLFGTRKRLVVPGRGEGFDALLGVRVLESGRFEVVPMVGTTAA